VNASKQRFGPDDMAELLAGAAEIVVAKGKKVLRFDMQQAAPSDEELFKAIIGPSGNLRAPTLRTGKTWHVGFHEEAYGEHFG
jgi:arsenate reductase-like glutaredoxin family protein